MVRIVAMYGMQPLRKKLGKKPPFDLFSLLFLLRITTKLVVAKTQSYRNIKGTSYIHCFSGRVLILVLVLESSLFLASIGRFRNSYMLFM